MSIWYLDTSVLLHALAGEPGADRWLRSTQPGQLFSSTLLRLETVRSIMRDGHDPAPAEPYLGRVALVGINDVILARAETYLLPLKTLDSLHLATAQEIQEAVMVSHDDCLKQAATRLGIPVLDPVGVP